MYIYIFLFRCIYIQTNPNNVRCFTANYSTPTNVFFSRLTVFQPFTLVKYVEAIRDVVTGRSLLGIVHVIGRYMWQFFGGFCVDGLYVYFLLVGTGLQIKIYILY